MSLCRPCVCDGWRSRRIMDVQLIFWLSVTKQKQQNMFVREKSFLYITFNSFSSIFLTFNESLCVDKN